MQTRVLYRVPTREFLTNEYRESSTRTKVTFRENSQDTVFSMYDLFHSS